MSMRNIAIILSGTGISGGTNVIFCHAMGLRSQGDRVTFVSKKAVCMSELGWHPICGQFDEFSWHTFDTVQGDSFDVVIATWWRTFFDLWRVDARRYLYFVQSIESRFYDEGDLVTRAAVDSTYEFPLGYVTEGRWISEFLKERWDHIVPVAPNGVDKSIFNCEGDTVAKRSENRLRVLVEGPIDVPFKNVRKTIDLCIKSLADEVWLLTSSKIQYYKGVDRVFSQVPLNKTADIYRSCDVIVKLSYVEGVFGPPLEMFHCGGTCVVYDVTGHDEYICDGRNGIVVKMDDEKGVVESINQLKTCKQFLEILKANAAETADVWPNWTESTREFSKAIDEACLYGNVDRRMLRVYSQRIWQMCENHYRLSAQQRFLGSIKKKPITAKFKKKLTKKVRRVFRVAS